MGNVITPDDISLILSLYYLNYTESRAISLPVNISNAISKVIEESGGIIRWTTTKLRNPDDSIDLFYGGKCRYPYLEQKTDPMITFLRLIEYLTLEKKELCELKENFPKTNITRTAIQCSIEEKAAIMGMLSTEAEGKSVELIDGVKIITNNSWILLMPDASQPLIHVYAEGDSIKERDRLINSYSEKIRQFRLAQMQ